MVERDPEIEALLPWYLNGTLAAEERAQVEAYLAERPEAAEELALLQRMRSEVRAQQPGGPGELGLRRLLKSVRAERREPARWRWAAAAAVLVVLVQSGIIAQLYQRDEAFRPLSGPAAGDLYQIRFHPDATEAALRELLLDADAVIVDGPSASGIYRLRLLGAEEREIRERRLVEARAVVLELRPETR